MLKILGFANVRPEKSTALSLSVRLSDWMRVAPVVLHNIFARSFADLSQANGAKIGH